MTRFVLESADQEVIDCPGGLICSESQTRVRSESCLRGPDLLYEPEPENSPTQCVMLLILSAAAALSSHF